MPTIEPTITQCRSCKAPVIWAHTATSRMLLNAEPSAQGTIELTHTRRGWHARVLTKAERMLLAEQELTLRTSHFATCPHAAEHRRRPAP